MDLTGQDAPLMSLDSLNAAQLECVLHPPNIPLQILAGPGSGKTKVLTMRIAYLISTHAIDPSAICAMTFTNKAAKEMKERLTKILGPSTASKLRLGTFHSLCAMFLRRYGHLVALQSNFTVADVEECKKIIAAHLKPHKSLLSDREITLKEATVMAFISREKSRGRSAGQVIRSCENHASSMTRASDVSFDPTQDIQRIMAEIYRDYEQSLRSSNCLDFDDLLVYGVKLFTNFDIAVSWCKHILVDEFQDTNIIQYELMRALARHNCVSTVGDPDQSIYAWRSAEVGNLARMQEDFKSTKQIFLEQNYRSTESILRTSLAIISQDKSRIQKTLHSSHPIGLKTSWSSHASEHDEATFIAQEIKRIVAEMGGMLAYGDFAVLLRFNALSRTIEGALQKEKIPSRVLAGHKFFERLEIKDLLAYLQLADNSDYHPAFLRAVNVPSRGIGNKSIAEITTTAAQRQISPLAAVEKICQGKIPDIKPPIKGKLKRFVTIMGTLRQLAEEGACPADILRRLIDLIGYEGYLRATQHDWESRWENVKELITFASEVDISAKDEAEMDSTTLRLFLQASMLSSEEDKQNPEESQEKVTISTCHAAKGLEWPVVIVPAVEEGTFPFYRSEDVEEERRLLYVACTRAQSLLYLSHASVRKVAAETKSRDASSFVTAVKLENETLFGRVPNFSPQSRIDLATVLNRQPPDEAEVERRLTKLGKTSGIHTQGGNGPGPQATPAMLSQGFSRPVIDGKGKNSIFATMPLVSTSGAASRSRLPGNVAVSVTVGRDPVNHPSGVTQAKPLPLKIANGGRSVSEAVPTSGVTPTAAGIKRRLGVGAGGTGYPGAKKKFKPVTIG